MFWNELFTQTFNLKQINPNSKWKHGIPIHNQYWICEIWTLFVTCVDSTHFCHKPKKLSSSLDSNNQCDYFEFNTLSRFILQGSDFRKYNACFWIFGIFTEVSLSHSTFLAFPKTKVWVYLWLVVWWLSDFPVGVWWV